MKKFLFPILTSFLTSLLLLGCGTDFTPEEKSEPLNNNVDSTNLESADIDREKNVDDVSPTPGNDKNSGQANEPLGKEVVNDQEAVDQMAKLGVVDFDLEVKYANQEKFELEFEKKGPNSYEAEIKNTLNGQNTVVRGKEAFQIFYNSFQEVNLQSNLTNDEIIQTIIQRLGLPHAYIEFEVEIIFTDGNNIEIDHRK